MNIFFDFEKKNKEKEGKPLKPNSRSKVLILGTGMI
jgi:hypothetical protein